MGGKSKNDSESKPRLGRLSFVLFWVLLTIIVAFSQDRIYDFIVKMIETILGIFSFRWQGNNLQALMLFTLVTTALKAPFEKLLLWLHTGKWIKGWISASLFGMALQSTISLFMLDSGLAYVTTIWLGSEILFFFLISVLLLPRIWVLRHYGKRAWVYFFASSISALLINMTIEPISNSGINLSVLPLALSSAISAIALAWLFQQPLEHEKEKVDEASSRLEDGLVDEADDENVNALESGMEQAR